MSLGEPQYPRKLMWWEHAEAKTTFLVWICFISCTITMVVCIWKAAK
jgi:hypothetical protein